MPPPLPPRRRSERVKWENERESDSEGDGCGEGEGAERGVVGEVNVVGRRGGEGGSE